MADPAIRAQTFPGGVKAGSPVCSLPPSSQSDGETIVLGMAYIPTQSDSEPVRLPVQPLALAVHICHGYSQIQITVILPPPHPAGIQADSSLKLGVRNSVKAAFLRPSLINTRFSLSSAKMRIFTTALKGFPEAAAPDMPRRLRASTF